MMSSANECAECRVEKEKFLSYQKDILPIAALEVLKFKEHAVPAARALAELTHKSCFEQRHDRATRPSFETVGQALR